MSSIEGQGAGGTGTTGAGGQAPDKGGLVLLSLILVAAVANLNLSVANVALPDIGASFDASQTALDLVAVGYSLGLAASVLWLGALGDRYGRKLMLILGVLLSIPACLLAAFAPTVEVLIAARLLGGLSAGMAYPTTLALIAALWSGPARTRSIALWSALGGAIAALGPLVSGFLLERFVWGSVFLVTLPLAVVALVMAMRFVPAHVNETSEPVDNLGGVLSAVLVGSAILAINFAPVPNEGRLTIALVVIAVVAGAAFIFRQQRAPSPLYDLQIAGRRVFWVAACAGIIVFGSLMGAMFIGQQYLQNVLGYSTFDAGASIIPAALFMVIVAPRSAKLVEARGARFTLLLGYVFVMLGFLTMFLLWNDGSPYWQVALGYSFVGIGVGFAGTPASHSLTGSVPVSRAGMASGTADLQRDLGGAFMQSIFGGRVVARRVRDGRRRGERRRTERRPDHDLGPERADQVVLERRGRGRAVPAIRDPDHGRRQDRIPGRRRRRVRRWHHRRPVGCRDRLPVLPEEDRRGTPARRVPRPGHRVGGRPDLDRPDTGRPDPGAPARLGRTGRRPGGAPSSRT
jgi:EmrB/QacA subfamily drug resistance transporter